MTSFPVCNRCRRAMRIAPPAVNHRSVAASWLTFTAVSRTLLKLREVLLHTVAMCKVDNGAQYSYTLYRVILEEILFKNEPSGQSVSNECSA